ncbi:MAG TPA: OsmC family protein [Spirochaetia bacterium]|nr:OsmC family protein [Spirochaetia bacterium]
MSEHRATIEWTRASEDFEANTYSRDHLWRFEGGTETPASAAPDYLGNKERVDPESSFVASLSSCHMLTFLFLCARRRFVVDRYADEAVGFLEKNAEGKMAVTRVELRPAVEFSGEKRPSDEELAELHERAHRDCFIANSVTTRVEILPLP